MTHSQQTACVVHADGLTLEARLVRAPGSAGAVIAPPHPLYGGSFYNPVVQAALQGMVGAGLSTLLFNFRGTEASEGVATDSLEAATSDYRAALTALREHVPGPSVAAGYSFGAGTALLMAKDDPQVSGVVLIAPPMGLLHAQDLSAFRGPLLVIVGDDDAYAPIPELEARLAGRPETDLQVLPGVDHFFHFGGLSVLQELIRQHVQGLAMLDAAR